ncbi:glycosyltransferase family 39 protein [Frigidibacter sp. SD6-1]|uniref:glycosyltransferase family 39 protein n=1 Tax=Frigidibacter sp. SD6-1 TaxID=3032581 RepID=UPI0024DF5EC4|nr:glycosyltransferase family 39 protein [Frigidibacter sp. SD6-1]
MTPTRADRLALGLILFLALALRLPVMTGPLWFDEIVTVQTHLKSGWGEMLSSYSMNHHYLHNLAAKLSMSVFGEQPWAIRLPALIFGLLGIWAMWRLALDLGGRLPALGTALLMALFYHHIWFSTNARGYTGLALFSTLGVFYVLRGLRSGRLADWLFFAACLAATIFTHLTGAFLYVTLGLLWLALIAARARTGTLDRATVTGPLVGFLLGGLVTLALYAPVVPSLLAEVSGVAKTSAGDPMQEYQNPLWTIYEGLRTGLGQAGPLPLLVGALAAALVLCGALALRRRAPLFAPITIGHILLTIALLLAVGMRIWPRFFFTDIPFLLFLLVMGVGLVCGRIATLLPARLGAALFPLAILAMAAVLAPLAARNYSAPKQDLAGAYGAVELARAPGERVFAISYSGEIFTGYFGADWGTIWTDADYRAAADQPGPLTVVVTFPARNLREYPSIAADLEARKLTERAALPGTLGDGYVLILHRD